MADPSRMAHPASSGEWMLAAAPQSPLRHHQRLRRRLVSGRGHRICRRSAAPTRFRRRWPPQPLSTPDVNRGETAHRWPSVLPGERILFLVLGKPEVAGIYTSSLANPGLRARLMATRTSALYGAGYLLWLRGSTLVAQPFDPERNTLSGELRPLADSVGTNPQSGILAAASPRGLLVHGQAGYRQLTWLNHAGQPEQPGKSVLGPPGDSGTFRLSPDGRRLVVSRGSGSGRDLWLVDVERDAWSRFTFLPGTSWLPLWSPDGRQVMFQAERNLYRKDVSGAGTEQRVTESANLQWPTDWSRDGRQLLYYELAPDTQRDLWVLPVTPDGQPEQGAKARPYLRTRFNEYLGRFSPEVRAGPGPRWVAYTSGESGRNEVYVQAFPEPRGKFQISTGGGTYPEWSPDGRGLYYESPEGKLMVADLQLGADSVTPSAPRELFTLPNTGIVTPYAVAPDGKRFLVTQEGGSQPLEVVVNWPALLKPGASQE